MERYLFSGGSITARMRQLSAARDQFWRGMLAECERIKVVVHSGQIVRVAAGFDGARLRAIVEAWGPLGEFYDQRAFGLFSGAYIY